MSRLWPYAALAGACAAAAFLLAPLLVKQAPIPAGGLPAWSDDVMDPAVWGQRFPEEYAGYRRPARTDPRWREPRGHAFSLKDREETIPDDDPRRDRIFAGVPRLRPQPGACLVCHAAVVSTLRRAGFEAFCATPYYQWREQVNRPITCNDCHDPATMRLRITRPAFAAAWKLPGETGLQQMRTLVCAQCHGEYYLDAGMAIRHPWSGGLTVEAIEAHYERAEYRDWEHPETGAPLVLVRHPQFEMWSQGVHGRAGVACADCHMPHVPRGAMRRADHRTASPLDHPGPACGRCHNARAEEMKARAEAIHRRTAALMSRAEDALLDLFAEVRGAAARGVPPGALKPARALHRRAHLRLNFVRADGSRGFHAPQEALRMLSEAIDYARQGQIFAAGAGRSSSASRRAMFSRSSGPNAR